MPAPSARLPWLDLFRGACVVGMIETHVLNTFLVSSSRETSWFAWLTYFDGLIAPAFLFIAGYVQGLGMRQAEGPRRNFGKRLRRLGGVWLLGYALHFPAPQLFAGQWSEALRIGTQVDVLQCLAVSLAVLLAFERGKPKGVDTAACLILLIAVFGSLIAEELSFGPTFLGAYLNTRTGSLFPLLPWMGFVCAGFLASAFAGYGFRPYFAALVSTLLLAFCIWGSVGFYFQRLAWLLAAVPGVQWIAGRWQPRWLLFAGRESLVLYAAHLLLIEALAVTLLPRHELGVAACALLFGGVLAASVVIAIAWRKWQSP